MPFTSEQFLEVFVDYHRTWPAAPWMLLSLGLASVVGSFIRNRQVERFPAFAMAGMWLWTGVAYHLSSFTTVNKAAYIFGVLFIVQGLLLIFIGKSLTFEFKTDLNGIAGAGLILYSIVAYPIVGMAVGHSYPRAPSFGLPCPLVIFSFGVFLWTRPPIRWALMVIPSIWVVVGTSGAFFFGIWEDLGLVAALLVVLFVRTIRSNSRETIRQEG